MTDIFPAEACCSVLVPFNLPEAFRKRDVVWFVDNEAAASAIIRGDSSSPDVANMVHVAHAMFRKLNSRVWIEWVDTKANPADGLSRSGLLDEWTQRQGWSLSIGSLPNWDDLETLLEPTAQS